MGSAKTNTKKSKTATAEQVVTMRYTDEELGEFRKHILSRLEEANTDYELLRSHLTGQGANSTDDTAPSFKFGEDATDVSTREENAQLLLRRYKYIEQLKNALVRIENRSYGICSVTGKLIPKERLKSVPTTTVSIEAKANRVNSYKA